jgi:hypothetical protein
MNGINKKKGLFRVALYFNEQDITTLAAEAEKAGFRRAGIPTKTVTPHAFADEWRANTDGLGPFIKACIAYYRQAEPARLAELARLATEKAAIEKKMAGMMV